jgi:hypothetical protein
MVKVEIRVGACLQSLPGACRRACRKRPRMDAPLGAVFGITNSRLLTLDNCSFPVRCLCKFFLRRADQVPARLSALVPNPVSRALEAGILKPLVIVRFITNIFRERIPPLHNSYGIDQRFSSAYSHLTSHRKSAGRRVRSHATNVPLIWTSSVIDGRPAETRT